VHSYDGRCAPLWRSVVAVGVHRRRFHGRPRTGPASPAEVLSGQAVATVNLRAGLGPAQLEQPEQARRGGCPSVARARRCVPAPHGGHVALPAGRPPPPSFVTIAPRAALLGLTLPAHVSAGERANVPKTYLCRSVLPWRLRVPAGANRTRFASGRHESCFGFYGAQCHARYAQSLNAIPGRRCRPGILLVEPR
jgi:hypothetical protein